VYSLGIIALACGLAAAATAEAVALFGTVRGKWRLRDCQRHPVFVRWFFSGLGLAVAGVILVAAS
jgi:H+/Cl- antiporter ClcA